MKENRKSIIKNQNNRDAAIRLIGVSKRYTLHHEKPTLVEYIFLRKKEEEFWALNNINLTICKGEQIGLIGPNGSGKTTLLETIVGITTPTQGSVTTKGKIVSLIDLEAGFHPDLTGEENILLNGMMIGMSKKEIVYSFNDIVDFAELGKFIDTPLYMYSQGMKLRLGFSILAYSNPDIVLLDEGIGVGDSNFYKKSLERIKSFLKEKKTVIIATHNHYFIKESCNRIIWLDKGAVIKDGKSASILGAYSRYYDRF